MKTRLFMVSLLTLPLTLLAANNQILGWNNLGMHCMDSDYSVFSILPPYNTIEAQLIVGGKLVTNGSGYTVTYQATADANGSFNSTAMGKGNYYTYAHNLFGATLGPEGGLAGWSMPGPGNTPQTMLFEPTNQPAAGVLTPVNWFRAEGIPLSPFDDAHNKNPYPMMRLIAKNSLSQPIATNDIVLPVSDEMDCRTCHASGTQAAAKPAAGRVWSGVQERDFRLNILRLHDEHQFAEHGALYQAALAARGFNPQGLYRGVVADNKPVLCAACHASEALGAPSYGTIPQLTTSIHSYHAHVVDPVSSLTLDSSANRSACYRCHPGSATKCLRGAMGGAIATDGSMSMQCQSCHGSMSTVGSASRVGWFMEPNCQSCHSGTATHNNGQIRYTSVFTTNGAVRVAVDNTFATTPNNPAAGISLYRFSFGHGGLQCSACHGSTHAEFPATHANDNERNIKIQGHAGVMVECTSCHTAMSVNSTTAAGGPHGMHPIGQSWVSGHHDYIGSMPGGVAACQACHGMDFRGTVLSRAQAARTLTANFDSGNATLNLYRGALIGCYNCHNGPANDSLNSSTAPTVNVVSGSTTNNVPLNLPVVVTPTSATLRIIAQPASGSLGVTNKVLTYFPEAGFVGTDTFTYAAYDGSKNSILATGTVMVVQGPVSISLTALVPTNAAASWPVALSAVATPVNTAAAVNYQWNFGDGSALSTNQFAQHVFTAPGIYSWQVVATIGSTSAASAGNLVITGPVTLGIGPVASSALSLTWPRTSADVVVEQSDWLGAGAIWTTMTNLPIAGPMSSTVNLPVSDGNRYFRVRQAW